MFATVMAENRRETDGTATRERVRTAMQYIAGDQTQNSRIAAVLAKFLGNESLYDSKADMWQEALQRLYPHEPSTCSDSSSDTSDSTIEVDLDSSSEIIVDLDALD